MRLIYKAVWVALLLTIAVQAQQIIEVTDWKMQDSATVGATMGPTIASSSFDASTWLTATVPGTVLSTLVDHGGVADPFYGENMISMPDYAAQQKRYWYYATFTVSATAGQHVWLDIEGINYQADIYLNGKSIGAMLGAFKGAKFNIDSIVNTSGANYLAVKIRGNYNPGTYHTKQNGSCGNNGGTMTQDGPTFIAAQGWDWIPTIPDRCMGIWKPVYIRVTGPVAIRTPWIRTTNVSASSATIPLEVTLLNSTNSAVTGTAKASIDGTILFADKTVSVPANGSTTVTFDPLSMTNPKLWWPNGYGDPNLYTCTVTFTPDGGSVSDAAEFRFGVREWSFIRGQACGLIVNCNGQRILCRGGNWGMDDGMKRWDLRKLENKVRYHKEMNFNMIRDWIGMTDNEPFYDFCDKYGIIVWADFWQPHSADGSDPSDLPLFQENMLDKIYRVRNHASLAIWCARNETAPNTTLLTTLQNYHTTYDGTRVVQPSSGSNDCHSGGPYTWTTVSSVMNAISGFHTEIGAPTVPSYESLSSFLPATNQMPMGNSWWSWHDYCSGNGNPENYTNAMTTVWGASATIQDVCKKAQLMNYDEYRAFFEALQTKRFSTASGVLLWMSNCVWPSMMWQTYDYYMEGTGAFYGCQKGSEPIHVMFYGGSNVQVINNTRSALSNYMVSAATYNLDGTKKWSNSQAISVAADASANAFAITKGTSAPYFLDLKLKDTGGNVVSKNFYWLPNDGTQTSNMMSMTKTTLVPTATATWTRPGDENTITCNIVNTGAVCAVACRLLLTQATSGTRILPVHYNDNYFSLIPGDTQSVTIQFDEIDRGTEDPKLCITGVNVDQTCIDISPVGARRNDGAIVRKTGMYVSWFGNNLKLFNIPTGKAWHLAIFDISGRIVLKTEGIGIKADVIVTTASLRSGAHVMSLTSEGKTYRKMILTTGHVRLR